MARFSAKKLAVIPELCSGCRLCELACAIEHFGVNNPKKSAVRVLVTCPRRRGPRRSRRPRPRRAEVDRGAGLPP
jgi:Fe-S-cluster-containing hydrogenase component 2